MTLKGNIRTLALRRAGAAGWILALVFGLASAAHGFQPFQRFVSGLGGEVVTLRGDHLPNIVLQLETPAELPSAEIGGPLYSFSSDPPLVEFEDIGSIIVARESTIWLGSEARAVEWYRLGSIRYPAPPPPDWNQSFGRTSTWRRSVPVEPGPEDAYLNRAQAFWAGPPDDPDEAIGEYLFRQQYAIQNAELITLAKLRLAGQADFMELSINGSPVHLANRKAFGIGEFEVTRMLHDGENLLAIRARTPVGRGVDQPWIAFHLEVTALSPRPERRSSESGSSLIVTRGGERLWGHVEELNPVGVVIRSRYGFAAFPWDSVAAMIFPTGWTQRETPRTVSRARAMFGRVFGRREPARIEEGPSRGIPLQFTPEGLSGRLLLADGRTTGVQPSRLEGDKLVLAAEAGQGEYSIEARDVVGVYPPIGDEEITHAPQVQLAALFARVTTTRGENIGGIVREINSRRVLLQGPGGETLEFSPKDLVRVSFPRHGLGERSGARVASKPRVGLIEAISPDSENEGGGSAFEKRGMQVQEAAFIAGLEFDSVAAEAIIDPNRLNPRIYQLLILADPEGRYIDTLREEGDVRSALVGYVESGGTLILYSRGGALRMPLAKEGRGFAPLTAHESLGSRLGLETAFPEERTGGDTRPFHRPPNQTQGLIFERSEAVPEGLGGLPPFIEVRSAFAPAFYPMTGGDERVRGVYALRSTGGVPYGPALSIISRLSGRVIIIDHLLWQSTIEGQPFTKTILPIIFSWAAQSSNRRAE